MILRSSAHLVDDDTKDPNISIQKFPTKYEPRRTMYDGRLTQQTNCILFEFLITKCNRDDVL